MALLRRMKTICTQHIHRTALLGLLVVALLAAGCKHGFEENQPGSSPCRSRFVKGGPKGVDASSSETVIVFVHGVFGDACGTWKASNGEYWPNLVATDEVFAKTDVYVHNFSTPKLRATYDIGELAADLRLRLDDAGIPGAYKNVIFVAHSMGGLVVRSYLLEGRPDARRFPVLLFYATPTTGSDIAKLADVVSRNPQLTDLRKMATDSPGVLGLMQSNVAGLAVQKLN